jgi:hypothetical protein
MFTPYSSTLRDGKVVLSMEGFPRFVNQRDGCTMVRFSKYGQAGLKSARKAWGPALSVPGQVQYNN